MGDAFGIFAFFLRDPPSTHPARLEWEASWEREMTGAVRGQDAAKSELMNSLLTLPYLDGDSGAMAYEFQVRNVLYLQQRHIEEVARIRKAPFDFYIAWMRALPSFREECILKGICEMMESSPAIRLMRLFCPDSTLAHLSSRNGKTFLDMLDVIALSEKSLPLSDPIYFPNALIEALCETHKTSPGMIQRIKVFRADCISRILWKTVRAFYGTTSEEPNIKQQRASLGSILGEQAVSPEIEALLHKSQSAARREASNACIQCGVPDVQLPPNKKLQACTGCLKIKRKILYCSRECQTIDWHSGVPTPHKRVCGRKVNDKDVMRP